VDLVVHQVAQLEHVDLAHRHRRRERLAGPAVAQPHLARRRQAGQPQQLRGRAVHVGLALLAQQLRQVRQLLLGQQVGRVGLPPLLQRLDRRLRRRPLGRRQRLVLGHRLGVRQLAGHLGRLARRQHLRGRREGVAHRVVHVARRLRHPAPAQQLE